MPTAEMLVAPATRPRTFRQRSYKRLYRVRTALSAGAAVTQLQARIDALSEERDRLQLQLGALTTAEAEAAGDFDHTHTPWLRSGSSAPSLEEAHEFFKARGYWVIPGAVGGEWLAQVQREFKKAQAPARALWEDAKHKRQEQGYTAVQSGAGSVPRDEAADLGEARLGESLAGRHAAGYFDIPRFVEQHDALLRLLDNPKVVPVVEKVMGGPVQVRQIQARTVPAEAARQYTHWHRDGQAQIAVHPEYSPTLKAFTFFYDVPADGGCAAVVPGSHRVQQACNPHWTRDMDQESIGYDGMPNATKPSFLRFPCKAGTVVMYDNRIFHNALCNTSGRDRCCLITSYQPFGRSQSGQVVANAQRLLQRGLLGEDRPVLRQLLGLRLGLIDGYSEPDYHLRNPSPDNR
jgi:hypothetical protein